MRVAFLWSPRSGNRYRYPVYPSLATIRRSCAILLYSTTTLRREGTEHRHVDLEEVAKAIAKVLPGADKLNHEQ
jgi:hypothetical protein